MHLGVQTGAPPAKARGRGGAPPAKARGRGNGRGRRLQGRGAGTTGMAVRPPRRIYSGVGIKTAKEPMSWLNVLSRATCGFNFVNMNAGQPFVC
eukprot:1859139-Prymnesium_polylepis.1